MAGKGNPFHFPAIFITQRYLFHLNVLIANRYEIVHSHIESDRDKYWRRSVRCRIWIKSAVAVSKDEGIDVLFTLLPIQSDRDSDISRAFFAPKTDIIFFVKY